MKRDCLNWQASPAPGIAARSRTPAAVRALEEACDAVDRDIEQTGAVSEETVQKCRDALALARA